MSLLGFSRLCAVAFIGGGVVAYPHITSVSLGSPSSPDFFLEGLKGKNVVERASKEQLTKSKCKVLVTDLEQKNQIIVCPSSPSVTFLFVTSGSEKLEKIEKFFDPKSTSDWSGQQWIDNYNLQFRLSATQIRMGSTTIKISKDNKSSFEQLKDADLTSCKLEDNKLLCKKSQPKGTTYDISLDLATNQEFSLKQ